MNAPAAQNEIQRPVKAIFSCSGVGVMNRGIESFFREAFDGLHGTPGLDVTLLKGAGPDAVDEKRIWCIQRTGWLAPKIGRMINRNAYVVEQLSSILPIARQVRILRPHVVFYSDNNMAMRLVKLRKWLGVPFRMVFSNGGPVDPPFAGCDHVQQVAPHYLEQAIAAGEPPEKHSMVPYGIIVPEGAPRSDPAYRKMIREKLRLPVDRQIVLSVGWIAAPHKRMDYTIQAIAALPEPRPFLMMLGAMDEQSPPVIAMAKEKLGEANFAARSVPYEQVRDYYEAADVFILSSLKEGFGRVYLEALMHGLPTIAHNYPVMKFVVGDAGITADLSKVDEGARVLADELRKPWTPQAAAERRESVRRRFDWKQLAPSYVEMFRRAAFGEGRRNS